MDLDVLSAGRAVQDVRHRDLPLDARVYQPPDPDDNSPTNTGKDVPGEAVAKFDLTGIDENADVTLHVKLTGVKDALPADDEAWLVLGIVRKVRILIVTNGNPLLDYFFDAKSTRAVADVATITPKEMSDSKSYIEPARDGRYDLVVFDRCAGGARRTCRGRTRSSSATRRGPGTWAGRTTAGGSSRSSSPRSAAGRTPIP